MKRNWLAGIIMGLTGIQGCLSESTSERFDKGMDLLYEGRYEDAESHFLTMAREAEASDLPEDRHWQAKALFQAGRVEHLYLNQPRRAVARIREALKVDSEAPFAFEAREEIAFVFSDRLKDYRTAALEFERLVQAFPNREGIEQYQYRIAQCYFILREFNQARTEARLLLEKVKTGTIAEESMLLIANSYYIEGRYQEAAEAHQRLLVRHPRAEIESRSLFELGMCCQELGDYRVAEKNLLAALKQHPRPDIVQHQLASLQERIAQEGSKAKEQLPYATAGRHSMPSVGGQPETEEWGAEDRVGATGKREKQPGEARPAKQKKPQSEEAVVDETKKERSKGGSRPEDQGTPENRDHDTKTTDPKSTSEK